MYTFHIEGLLLPRAHQHLKRPCHHPTFCRYAFRSLQHLLPLAFQPMMRLHTHTHMCEAVELPGRSWPLGEGGASHTYTLPVY